MSPVVQQIKAALTPSIPIEQVVYLNDDKVVSHEKGSNRYWINYPDTWRTVANQQLVLGVRAIRKQSRTVGWTLHFELTFERKEVPDKSGTFVFHDTLLSSDTLHDLVVKINRQWKAWGEELSEDEKVYFTDYLSRTWKSQFMDDGQWLYGPEPWSYQFTVPYTIKLSKSSTGADFKLFFEGPYTLDQYNPKSKDYCNNVRFSVRDSAFIGGYATYLLAASFVGQETSYQYLGFTNTVFNPPKQYLIPHSDTKFWIDLITADGTREVELDSRDLIVIELQLSTIPFQKYV